jgi:transposase-like protein
LSDAPEVIILALRWYLRYSLSYRDVEELLAERGITVDHVTIYRGYSGSPGVDRRRPAEPNVAGDRWFVDETYLKGCWAVGVPVPGDRPARAGHRCPGLAEAGSGGNPPVLRPGTERGATADRGDHRPGSGVPACARRARARGVARRGAVRHNPIEADHGRWKARTRPVRGLERIGSAQVVCSGHAFIQNLRRGHYELAFDTEPGRRLEASFTELALAI